MASVMVRKWIWRGGRCGHGDGLDFIFIVVVLDVIVIVVVVVVCKHHSAYFLLLLLLLLFLFKLLAHTSTLTIGVRDRDDTRAKFGRQRVIVQRLARSLRLFRILKVNKPALKIKIIFKILILI